MVAELGQAVGGQLVDLPDVRFLRGLLVRVGEQPGVDVRQRRLRLGRAVPVEVTPVDHHASVLAQPGREAMQPLGRFVVAAPAVEAKVPAMYAADEVVPLDPPIGQQRTPVRTPALEHHDPLPTVPTDGVLGKANDDQVEAVDNDADRLPHRQIGQDSHVRLPPRRICHQRLDTRHLRPLHHRRGAVRCAPSQTPVADPAGPLHRGAPSRP